MRVFVISDGIKSNEKTWSADGSRKQPTKGYVRDIWGYPDREIKLDARLYTRAYDQSGANYADSLLCQNKCRAINFRNSQDDYQQICDIFDDGFSESDTRPVRHFQLRGDGHPDVDPRSHHIGQVACKLGGNILGYSNITFEVTQDYGRSRSYDRIMGTDLRAHDIVSYARIDAISSSESGTNGGGILKITGDYFESSNPAGQKTDILIVGQKCDIISLSMTEIQCRIPAGVETDQEYYPGHRGINVHGYKGQQYTIAEMEALNLQAESGFEGDYDFHHLNNDAIEAGIRPWRFESVGYSSFAPFYFNPKVESRYELYFDDMMKWNSGLLDAEFNDIWLSRDTSAINPSVATPAEPVLLKFGFYERPGNDGKKYYQDHWVSRPMLKLFETDISSRADVGFNWPNNLEEKTVHHYDIEGSFKNEIQEIEIQGDTSLMSGIQVQYGDQVIDQMINFENNPIQDIKTAVQSTQGATCPDGYIFEPEFGTVYHHDFESCTAADLGYENSEISVDSSLCGSKSLKIPTANNDWFYIFNEDTTNVNCGDDSPLGNFATDWDKWNLNRYLCFAYKGDFKLHSSNHKSIPEITFSYFDAGGNYHELENLSMWASNIRIKTETLNTWQFECLDLQQNFKWTQDKADNGEIDSKFSKNNGGNGFRIKSVRLRLNSDISSFAYLDHITLSGENSKPSFKSDDMELIVPAEGPIIKDISVTETSANKFSLEIVPGACSTGHGLIQFSGTDLKVTKDGNNWLKYRKSDWPSNTYLRSRRVQASASTLEGSLALTYSGRAESVILDTSSPSVASFVNSFAAAKMATEITFDREFPTCEKILFEVKFNRPGRALPLPSYSGLDQSVSTSGTIINEGFIQVRADMSWFLTAHKKPQVQLAINDVHAACPNSNCDFEYFDNLNIEITNLAINNGKSTEMVGGQTELTFTGSNLENLVIESPPCLVTAATASEVTCLVNTDAAAGEYDLVVYDTALGLPTGIENYNQNKYTVVFSVDSISSNAVPMGGEWLTISGTALTCDMEVYTCLQNAENCNGNRRFTCEIDPNDCGADSLRVFCAVASQSQLGDYDLYLNGGDAGQVITYQTGPQVKAIESASGSHAEILEISPMSTETVTIKTSNSVFSTVNLSRNNIKIYIGKVRVFGTGEVFDNSITIDLPGQGVLPPGEHLLQVLLLNEDNSIKTYVYSQIQVKVNFKVTSISKSSGSQYGGGAITINGKGFDVPEADNLRVKIGENECTDVDIKSATKLTCQIPSSQVTSKQEVKLNAQNEIQWNDLIEIYEGDSVRWNWQFDEINPFAMRICQAENAGSVQCLANGWKSQTEKTVSGDYQRQFNLQGTFYVSGGCLNKRCTQSLAATVVVAQRPEVIASEINLQISGDGYEINPTSAPKIYSYNSASTALVYDTNFDSTGLVITDEIVLEGTNFLGNGRTSRDVTAGWSVSIGDHNCVISQVTDKKIKCRVDAANEPELLTALPISLSNQHGRAGILTEDVASSYLALLPAVTNLGDNTEGSVNGGTKLEVYGYGLDSEDVQVLFDGVDACQIIEQSYTKLVCLTPKFDSGDPSTVSNGSKAVSCVGKAGVFENLDNDSNFNYKTGKTLSIASLEIVGGNTYIVGGNRKKREVSQDVLLAGTKIRWTLDQNSGNEVEVYLNGVLCENTNNPGECKIGEALAPGPVEIRVADSEFGNVFISDSLNLNLVAPSRLTSVEPDTGSILGGQTITISGTGFSALTTISINGQLCVTESYTTSEFVCTTPASVQNGENSLVAEPEFENTLSYFYETSSTPTITSLSANAGSGGDVLTLTGSSLGNSVSGSYVKFDGVDCALQSATETALTCELGQKAGGPVSNIEFFINDFGIGQIDMEAIKFRYNLAIDSISITKISTAGGAEIVVSGQGFSQDAYLELCETRVENIEIVGPTSLKFNAPPSENLADAVCEIEVFNPDDSAIYRYLRYDSDIMPEITSVTPDRGGTAGGTQITISGTGFKSINDPTVMVSTAACTQLEVKSDTEMVCITGPLSKGSPQNTKIEIVSASGNAKNDETYFWYIDRWNSKYTWGGTEPPVDGDMAVIDQDQTVLIDGETAKLKMLLVNGGHLIFDPTVDCHIRAENILITNGGSITAGTEAEPYQGNIKIEMFGKIGDLELPVYGA